MKMTPDEFLTFLYDNLDNIFDVLQLILMAWLGRKLNKPIHTVLDAASKDSTVEVAAETVPASPPVDLKALKKSMRDQLFDDLELFYSNKNIDDMTPDEQDRVQRLAKYLAEVTQNNV